MSVYWYVCGNKNIIGRRGGLAYLHLVRAKKEARESFSNVIKRARWDEGGRTCENWLARAKGKVSEEILDRLDRAQSEDAPPPEPWHR